MTRLHSTLTHASASSKASSKTVGKLAVVGTFDYATLDIETLVSRPRNHYLEPHDASEPHQIVCHVVLPVVKDDIRQHTSAYVSIRQHTSAYVGIRRHTSAYVGIRELYDAREPHQIVRYGFLPGADKAKLIK